MSVGKHYGPTTSVANPVRSRITAHEDNDPHGWDVSKTNEAAGYTCGRQAQTPIAQAFYGSSGVVCH